MMVIMIKLVYHDDTNYDDNIDCDAELNNVMIIMMIILMTNLVMMMSIVMI